MNPSPVGMPLLPPGGGLRVSEPWNASLYRGGAQFFIYELDFGQGATFAPNPASPNVDGTFQILNDSDFFWTELAIFALDSNGDAPTINTDVLPTTVIQVTDIATGRQYDSSLAELAGFTGNTGTGAGTQALPTANVSGNAQVPFILQEPVCWEKNSVIKVTLNNEALNSGVNGVLSLLHLSFIGIKAFY